MNDLDDLVTQLARETRSYVEERISKIEAARAIEFAEWKSRVPDMAAVLQAIADAFAGLPKPADGKSITVEDVRPLIEDTVRREFAAVPKPQDGAPGANGKDAEVDYDRIGNMIAVAVEKETGKYPTPRDGRDGVNGKDGTNGKDGAPGRDADVEIVVARVLERMPKPENGKDGAPGRDGDPGIPGPRGEKGEKGDPGLAGKDGAAGINGKDGAAGERGEQGLAGKDGERGTRGASAFEVAREHGFVGDAIEWLASLRGKDGANGRDADDIAIVQRVAALIPRPVDGKDGRDGADGKDAVVDYESVSEMVRREVGVVAAEIPTPRDGRDGSPGMPGVPGEPGADGKDGRDGWSPEDLDLELRDGRTLAVRLRKGPRVVERTLRLATPLDRGVWVKGRRYEQGDVVSYAGSAFIAQRDTDAVIGGDPPSPDWRLLVKRGRDAS